MVSIIIRTKDEERWITSCLKAVFRQTFKDFEVIIVDNKSTDKTVTKAKAFDVKIVVVEDYRPGKALNAGIRHGQGDVIVCLSGHCIPVDDEWLFNLVGNLKESNVAGVYGRQEPMSFSSDQDKRDLLTVFGLDRKIQKKDPFFHNANSAIKRNILEEIPFDEKVTNIEDRVWGNAVIERGYHIVYDPTASVYHYHGIHQNGNVERCANVLSVLEKIHGNDSLRKDSHLSPIDLNIVGIVPMRGKSCLLGSRPLIQYTIERALQSEYLDHVIVSCDDPDTAQLAEDLGASAPFQRDPELSKDHVGVDQVLKYTLRRLEEMNVLADVLVLLEPTYPFRRPGLIDEIIEEFVVSGVDSLIPAYPEYKTTFREEGGTLRILGKGFVPRQFRTPTYVSLSGLGSVMFPALVRNGEYLGGERIGIFEVNDSYSRIEVRDKLGYEFASRIIDDWWRNSNSE